MAVLDPSGFQMAVRVIADDGTVYKLWSSTADDSGASDVTADTTDLTGGLPIVESVDLEIGIGLNCKATINVAAPFDLGLQLLRSPLFRIGNTYEVQLGYPKLGRFTPWCSFFAARPQIRIDAENGLSATLNGEGGAFAALRGSRGAVYENTTYRQIIEENCDRYGWDKDLPDSQGSDDPLDRDRPTVSQSHAPDWFFLQFIIRSANCDAYIMPSDQNEGRQMLRVLRRSETAARQPLYGFVMRGRVDFESYFPMFEFDAGNAEGVWLPGGSIRTWAPGAAAGVSAGDVSPDDDDEEPQVEASPETSTVPATADAIVGTGSARVGDMDARVYAPMDDESATGRHLPISARDPRGQQEVVDSHHTEAQRCAGVQCSISTIGIPELFPGEIISVINMGIFDTNYEVLKVSHKCSPGEWTMGLDLICNAASQEFLAQHLITTPQITNVETPPEPVGDATSGGTEEVTPEPA